MLESNLNISNERSTNFTLSNGFGWIYWKCINAVTEAVHGRRCFNDHNLAVSTYNFSEICTHYPQE